MTETRPRVRPRLQNPQRLRDLRIKAGLNQPQLAARIGMSKKTISDLESVPGRKSASPRSLRLLADALGCDVEDLLADRNSNGGQAA